MREPTAVQSAREIAPLKVTTTDENFKRMSDVFDAVARRAYEIFESNGRIFGRDVDDWFEAEAELLHPVHLEVAESDRSISIRAEVPGFIERELEVSVEPNRLTISGRREDKEERKSEKKIYCERCSDFIYRSLDLPVEVDATKVTATLKNGVLELEVPKAVASTKFRIEPKAA
jgi:HSP20 family protein